MHIKIILNLLIIFLHMLANSFHSLFPSNLSVKNFRKISTVSWRRSLDIGVFPVFIVWTTKIKLTRFSCSNFLILFPCPFFSFSFFPSFLPSWLHTLIWRLTDRTPLSRSTSFALPITNSSTSQNTPLCPFCILGLYQVLVSFCSMETTTCFSPWIQNVNKDYCFHLLVEAVVCINILLNTS